VGCKLISVKGGKAKEVYFNKNMKNHHGGVLLLKDHLYGYSDGVGWACMDYMSGEVVWREKKALGKGAVTFADGRLYCVDERQGTVVLADASPNGWNELGRFVLSPKSSIRSSRGKIWTHPVVCNGKLYLRDQEFVYCYDVQSP
jgi:outer membrane protein assembly factor BamB